MRHTELILYQTCGPVFRSKTELDQLALDQAARFPQGQCCLAEYELHNKFLTPANKFLTQENMTHAQYLIDIEGLSLGLQFGHHSQQHCRLDEQAKHDQQKIKISD